jgi:hypothetical protein
MRDKSHLSLILLTPTFLHIGRVKHTSIAPVIALTNGTTRVSDATEPPEHGRRARELARERCLC